MEVWALWFPAQAVAWCVKGGRVARCGGVDVLLERDSSGVRWGRVGRHVGHPVPGVVGRVLVRGEGGITGARVLRLRPRLDRGVRPGPGIRAGVSSVGSNSVLVLMESHFFFNLLPLLL